MTHLIFEGAELTGKSFTIQGVWNALEQQNNSGQGVMDGCIWFNADVGVYGTKDGWPLIQHYLDIINTLSHKNLIFEKFHLTQHLYTKNSNTQRVEGVENILLEHDFRLIITTVQPQEEKIQQKLDERLKSMPAYQRIARTPKEYLEMQENYLKLVKKSKLPSLILDNTDLPNNNAEKVLKWIKP